MNWMLVALSFVPGALAVAWHVRARRAARRFQAALEAEREETRRRYAAEDDIMERRQSFSGYPFARKK